MPAYSGPPDSGQGLPDPPVPADLDLRHLRDMPLRVQTLLSSRIMAVGSFEEIVAALRLWCESWHQVPAASLPKDDRELAALAGYARNVPGWLAVKPMALHGYTECSDGRLYHETIAEIAVDQNSKFAKYSKAAKARWGLNKNATHMQRISDEHATHMQREEKSRVEQNRDGSTGLVDSTEPENKQGRQTYDSGESVESPPLNLEIAPEPHREPQLAVQAWNALASEIDRPKVQVLSDTRRRNLAARLRECGGLGGWELALGKARDSPFLSGRTEHNFPLSFDWIIKPANFTKIMEGNYDDRGNKNGAGRTRDADLHNLFEETARRLDERHPKR